MFGFASGGRGRRSARFEFRGNFFAQGAREPWFNRDQIPWGDDDPPRQDATLFLGNFVFFDGLYDQVVTASCVLKIKLMGDTVIRQG